MANLRTNNLSGEQGQNAYRGSVFFSRGTASAQSDSLEFSGIAIGTSDFTIEGWLYKTKTGDYPVIFDTRESGNSDAGGFFLGTNSSNYFYFYTQSTNAIKQTIISNFSWYHFALVRTGGTTTLYLNGQVTGTYSDSNNYSNDITKLGTSQQYTGGVQNNWNWGGYLSNIRIVVGSAVYTSAFTPPTSELKAIPNTKLLCCQDSDNPLKEETGRSLTGKGSFEHLNDTELVTNGSGTTTTGWTNANTSTFTVEEGMIKVTRSGGTGPTAYQTITTVTGQQYTVSANIQYGSGNYADLRVYNGSDSSGTLLVFLRSTSSSTDGKKSSTFIAESTSTSLFFTFDDGGNTGKFSQISVKAADRGKQPEVIPPYGVDAGNTFGGSIQQSSEGYMYFPTGRTEERGGTRGLVMGGFSPSAHDSIDFTIIQSDGNAIDFGILSVASGYSGGLGNSTRGIITLQYQGSPEATINTIEFVTITNASNSIDFGDMATTDYGRSTGSNDTRGIISGGSGNTNAMEFITIATLGNGSDFGDLTQGRREPQSTASSTRLVTAGGYAAPSTGSRYNIIDFVTIATTGNAQDFGDLTSSRWKPSAFASPTRGVFTGGNTPSSLNVIDFLTIASTGDATDFGDLLNTSGRGAGCSDHTRGITFIGQNPANNNIIEVVTIQTTGNSKDFGDRSFASHSHGALSNGHGGLP